MWLEHVPGGGPGPGVGVVDLRGGRSFSSPPAPPTTSTRPSRSRTAVWPERGVPIDPVAIQVPVDRGNARARSSGPNRSLVSNCGATTTGRLGLGEAVGCGFGARTRTTASAPPSAIDADDHSSSERGSGHRIVRATGRTRPAGGVRWTSSRTASTTRSEQDFHPLCEVGGEECFGIAWLRHASCSWSRMGVRASASSAARIAAVA